MSTPLEGDDDHPLLYELKNIRAALARYQDESHASAVKLQRRSFDNIQSHERAVCLQRENDLLKAELAVLRATPAQSESSPESKALIQELSLSLRRLSLKLTMTEETLLEKTKALLNTHVDFTKAQAARDAANGHAAELRAREMAEKVKVKDLGLKIRKQEEELRMSDVVIGEYADLVRQLEARPTIGDQAHAEAIRSRSSTLDSALSQGQFDLQHVIQGFCSQYDETYQELEKTRRELEIARSQLLAKQQAENAVMEDFARTKAELDQLRINDGTAAKMVARYMQFSQSSTNSLLASVEALKTRHSATVSTLSSQNQLLLIQIRSLELQNEQLRRSLDDLGGEVLKEKYGRRREIGLRIRMEGRDQRIAEGLRRWVRQSEEAVKQLDCLAMGAHGEYQHAILALSQDARILLDALEQGGVDEETAVSLSGSRARELMVRGGVDGLLEELRIETERRVMLLVFGNGTVVDAGQGELEPKGGESSPQGNRNSQDNSALSLATDNQIRGEGHVDETMVVVTPSTPDLEEGNTQMALVHVEEVDLPQATVQSLPFPQHGADTTPDRIITQNDNESPQLEGDKANHDPTADEIPIVEPPSDSGSTSFLPQPMVNGSSDVSLSIPITTPVKADVHTDSLVQMSRQDTSTSHLVFFANSDPSSICPDPILPDSPQKSNLNTNPKTLSPSTNVTSGLPVQPVSEEREEPLPHPLLARLAEVNKRYDVFRRGFRDCHLALEGLNESLHSVSVSKEVHSFPVEFLRPAVARLDDFTEDVRVELEIKIGDEALLVKGYEALLRVPGALTSYTRSAGVSIGASSADGDDADISFSTSIEEQIKAFIDGTDPTVKRAGEIFKAKLEDVQHDIAVLKRAIHDPESVLSEHGLPASASSSTSVASMQKTEQGLDSAARPVGGGWSSWIRSAASRPTTPTSGFGQSPTFGNIMTNPRLRQSSFQTVDHKFTEGERSRGLGILGSFVNLTGKDSLPPRDPLSGLGLRIAMPSFNADGNGFASPIPMSATFGGLVSPPYPSNFGVGPPPTPRARTLSAMYMVGLGGRMSRTASINSNGPTDNGVRPEVEQAGREGNDHDIE